MGLRVYPMPGPHGFEDLRTWQLARELVSQVYRLTDGQRFKNDLGLREQMRRAAVSCTANIAEGFERGSNREFVRFLYMARGSAGELRSHIYLARDLNYLDQPEFQMLQESAVVLSRSVYSFITKLNSKDTRS